MSNAHVASAPRTQNNPSGSNASAPTLTAPGVNHTKGDWTTVVTSSIATDLVLLRLRASAAAVIMVDIGIGSTGNAVDATLIENVLVGINTVNGAVLSIPLRIPSGTRIAMRYQRNTSITLQAGVTLVGRSALYPTAPARYITYNADTTNTRPTVSHDPGSTANTKGGTPDQLVASTPAASKGFLLSFGNAGVGNVNSMVDIMTGAAASEVAIMADYATSIPGSSHFPATTPSPFIPLPIPAGSRVSYRTASSSTTATDRNLGVILHLGV